MNLFWCLLGIRALTNDILLNLWWPTLVLPFMCSGLFEQAHDVKSLRDNAEVETMDSIRAISSIRCCLANFVKVALLCRPRDARAQALSRIYFERVKWVFTWLGLLMPLWVLLSETCLQSPYQFIWIWAIILSYIDYLRPHISKCLLVFSLFVTDTMSQFNSIYREPNQSSTHSPENNF